jgi:hypothetical protein
MKTIIIIIALVVPLALRADAQTNLGSIHLAWNYPSNEIALADSQGPPTCFLIRATNSLAGSPAAWPVVVYQPWTNLTVAGFDGTNYTFNCAFQVTPPGRMFFVATASNFWGESGFSNTSSTPALPSILKTQIFKN